MARDRSGRGGLSPAAVAAIVRLLALDPPLAGAAIAARCGCHVSTVNRIRRGDHRTFSAIDRRGLIERNLSRVIDLLAASDRPNYTQIARLAGVERRVVARIAHGQHISQRLPHRPIGPLSLPRSR